MYNLSFPQKFLILWCHQLTHYLVPKTIQRKKMFVQENYSPSEMFQDLKNQSTIFRPDASRSGERLKANQTKNFSYHKKKFRKEERSFLPSWHNKWTWLHFDETDGSVYCIICRKADHYNMLNDIRIENSLVQVACVVDIKLFFYVPIFF